LNVNGKVAEGFKEQCVQIIPMGCVDVVFGSFVDSP
jgi:hypothetical protein